eukprot:GEMP01010763.1.p1 GENE.GEMP01010763.1~~GEMP01010763.1.p1  ORF type:complete len:380 (+),score=50.62 GEMP01010763.1:141-1280(+)
MSSAPSQQKTSASRPSMKRPSMPQQAFARVTAVSTTRSDDSSRSKRVSDLMGEERLIEAHSSRGQSDDAFYIDGYGFEYQGESALGCQLWDERFRPTHISRQTALEQLLTRSTPSLLKKSDRSKFQALCRRGLFTTAENRGLLWAHALGATDSRNSNPGEYQQKINSEISDKVRDDIECDLGRSVVNHNKFRGENSLKTQLRRVLRALAAHYPKVGYVQGMNIICGQLLIFMDEDMAFWCMVRIFSGSPNSRHPWDLGLLHYYSPNMELLFCDLEILKQLILSRKKAAAALGAILKHDLSLDQFFVKWFLTFTAGAIPSDTTFRIWDSFFVEGIKVIFRIIVVLLERHKDEFVAAKDLEGNRNFVRPRCTDFALAQNYK